jgi:hypothetical protein
MNASKRRRRSAEIAQQLVMTCMGCGKYKAKWLTGHGRLCGRCRNRFWRKYLERRR